jgi:hypothetical protein
MREEDKLKLLENILSNRPENKRIYFDEFSNTEFHIEISLNLSDIISTSKTNSDLHKRYANLVVDGKSYSIEPEVIDMCYRCSKYVVEPKLTMEDWLLLSLYRGDLIIAINAEIADMMLSSVNSLSKAPLASMTGMNLLENSMP